MLVTGIYGHSYVRGNWRRFDESGPLILTKCCHDMDIAAWLVDTKVKRVTSVGEKIYYKEENAPEGATARCLDCPAEKDCVYSAKAQYMGEDTEFPVRCCFFGYFN